MWYLTYATKERSLHEADMSRRRLAPGVYNVPNPKGGLCIDAAREGPVGKDVPP